MKALMRLMPALLIGLCASTNVMALDTQHALHTFQNDLKDIKTKLLSGKMNASQAQIMLLAIQARQNNVIIAQNNEILEKLSHESK